MLGGCQTCVIPEPQGRYDYLLLTQIWEWRAHDSLACTFGIYKHRLQGSKGRPVSFLLLESARHSVCHRKACMAWSRCGLALVQKVPGTEQPPMVVETQYVLVLRDEVVTGLCVVNRRHVSSNTCSIREAGAGKEARQLSIHQLFLSASANASHCLASTSGPLAEAPGLHRPGSRGAQGEPGGLRSLFSRL